MFVNFADAMTGKTEKTFFLVVCFLLVDILLFLPNAWFWLLLLKNTWGIVILPYANSPEPFWFLVASYFLISTPLRILKRGK